MAEDVREAIMARLVVLMGTISGVDEVARNVLVLDDEEGKTRRITILEGDEMSSDQEPVKRRPPNSPLVIHMHPQILLSNFADTSLVGSGLSAMRTAIIKKVAADTALTALTLDNLGGRYLGMESDLAFARAMAGETALKFQFTYVLRPDQL